MSRITISVIKGLIGVLIVALVGIQWVTTISHFSSVSDVERQIWVANPVIWACVFCFVVCLQVVLVCVWKLVSLAAADRIFNPSSFTWVNVALSAVIVATAVVVVGSVTALIVTLGVPLFVATSGGIAALFGMGLAMVIIVMRALLRQATLLQTELSEVV